jgi:hypothetical protein
MHETKKQTSTKATRSVSVRRGRISALLLNVLLLTISDGENEGLIGCFSRMASLDGGKLAVLLVVSLVDHAQSKGAADFAASSALQSERDPNQLLGYYFVDDAICPISY